MPDAISLSEPPSLVLPSSPGGDVCSNSVTVAAPDGSTIHVPHTVYSMGDRIEPTGSACAPSHPSAPAAGTPTSTGSGAAHGPLKVIGVVHAHLHDSRTASGAGEHQHGDLIVRSDGSADSKATLDHYAGMVTDISRTVNDPTTVQNHALSALSPDPIQKSEGLYKLGSDIVSATPTLVSAAPGAIASGATNTWSALHDYVMSSEDPDAAQRTVDRMKAAGSAVYGATLAPLVDDASTLGKTVASSASGNASLADMGIAGLATGAQAIQWAAPEAKGAGAIAEGTAHVAESEATRAAGDAITRDAVRQPEGITQSETTSVGPTADTKNPGVETSQSSTAGVHPLRQVTLASLEQARKIEKLDPDTVYIVPAKSGPGGYPERRFQTDHLGRPVKTSGDLSAPLGKLRNKYRDWKIGKSGRANDLGFHLAANRFGFPGGRLNVVPGAAELNKAGSSWGKLESHLATLQGEGHNVQASFQAVYNRGNTGARPDQFIVEFRVDGGDIQRRTFFNK